MPRHSKSDSNSDKELQQLSLDLDALLKSGQVFSREEVAVKTQQGEASQDYDPIAQTAEYMQRAVQVEEAWETTIQRAREDLLRKDPRQLYLDFLTDLKVQIEQNSPQAPRLAHMLEQVAIRGLGISKKHLWISKPTRSATRWRVQPFDIVAIEEHLDAHVVGKYFLNPIAVSTATSNDQDLFIASSDVSQHRSAVPVPARFFKRSVPFVLNNAAGTLFQLQNGTPKYENVFNPKPDESLLRWMLIDPSYQDELEPEDYQRCLASAMDVGQYKFDLEFLLKAGKHTPNVIFRDGSIFPQDAYLDNFVIETKRGDFTREAIIELLNCLIYAREVGILYCGVSKNVQLKVYSALLDWFISRNVDKTWEVGGYTLNDGQAMSLLLGSPSFAGDNLEHTIATCLIRRSFTTRANLNTRADLDDLDTYFAKYQEMDITPFRRLCEIAHLYMFFIGHSKGPQQQLPRYEFFYTDSLGAVDLVAQKILSSVQRCGLMNDEDHSFMAERPITYLLPSVTQQAHILSKDVGKYIDTATGQWIMARYRNFLARAA